MSRSPSLSKNAAKEFYSTSPSESPAAIIHVAIDKDAGLGAKLIPMDREAHMFTPGYAVIAKVFPEGAARGVQAGDVLVAVNGRGFRRFAPDYEDNDPDILKLQPAAVKVDLDHRVVSAD